MSETHSDDELRELKEYRSMKRLNGMAVSPDGAAEILYGWTERNQPDRWIVADEQTFMEVRQ